jgi:CspA family cold shock protein
MPDRLVSSTIEPQRPWLCFCGFLFGTSKQGQIPQERGWDSLRGVVKWFNDRKGYGFIMPSDGGKDIFVHHSGIHGEGFKTLYEGDEVEFDVEQEDRGPKAIHVNRVECVRFHG